MLHDENGKRLILKGSQSINFWHKSMENKKINGS